MHERTLVASSICHRREASIQRRAYRLAEGRREDGAHPPRLPSLPPLELLLLLLLVLGAWMLLVLRRRAAAALILVIGNLSCRMKTNISLTRNESRFPPIHVGVPRPFVHVFL